MRLPIGYPIRPPPCWGLFADERQTDGPSGSLPTVIQPSFADPPVAERLPRMPILSRQHSGRLSAILFVIPLLTAVLTGHAFAADLIVVTAGAFKPVLLDLAPAYESRTHDKIA